MGVTAMVNYTRDNFSGVLNTIGDALSRAHGDNSGLTSVVIEYLGKEGSPGIPVVRARAKDVGLDGLLEYWRRERRTKPLVEDLLVSLFTEEQISSFADQTGLSREATIRGLSDILPEIVYQNAVREHATPSA